MARSQTPAGPARRKSGVSTAARSGGSSSSRTRGSPRRRMPGAVTGKLRAHNPFELIRWLALSQPDPRKALSELVQNSLDAGARSRGVWPRATGGVGEG